MYGKGVKYALNGVATSVHKFFGQPSGPNQGYRFWQVLRTIDMTSPDRASIED